MNDRTLLHRDDGLADTRIPNEKLADIELRVSNQFLQTAGKLLDLGCGRGRTSAYFGEKRFDVVGVDIDMQTLRAARGLAQEVGVDCEFVLADGRNLCFRDFVFDYVISFGSTLSEKFRVWLSKRDRELIALEALRVTRKSGFVLFDFVHRYWNAWGFLNFLRYYWAWAGEKLTGVRTELGDYTEMVGSRKIRFHGFTVREARSLFPSRGVRLRIWKRDGWPFMDWFFVVAEKTGA